MEENSVIKKNKSKQIYSDSPNAGDPSDGRKKYDWISHYPLEARREIRWELFYLLSVFFLSLFLIFATWYGWINVVFNIQIDHFIAAKKYFYYAFSGLLGGIIFGMKYFYRSVARGFWHQDRRAWRIMSPLIAMTVAFVVGLMFNSSIDGSHKQNGLPTVLLFGFLAGYFADEAVGKMYEIANVIFGKTKTKNG